MFLDKDERLLPLISNSNPLTPTSLRGLKEVGIKTVRLNCWAYWSEMEPEPGTYCWDKAIEENVDLYLTGESSHAIYHTALEAGINVIFGGHYATEVYGVKLLADKVFKELSLETVFIDVPTGL